MRLNPKFRRGPNSALDHGFHNIWPITLMELLERSHSKLLENHKIVELDRRNSSYDNWFRKSHWLKDLQERFFKKTRIFDITFLRSTSTAALWQWTFRWWNDSTDPARGWGTLVCVCSRLSLIQSPLRQWFGCNSEVAAFQGDFCTVLI